MSQITRTIVTAITVLAVLIGSMAIELGGGQAAATTIRPDKEQVRRSVVVPGTMTDSCVEPGSSSAKNARPTIC
jgi:hypothetical protein